MEPCRCKSQNFAFVRGDTFTITGTYESSNSACPPVLTPIDITTASIQLICKRYANDPDAGALFSLTVGTGVTITNGPAGQFSAVVPQSATEGLPVGIPFPYQVVIELSGARETVMGGTLTLLENVADA
jgi:hypothetical protein